MIKVLIVDDNALVVAGLKKAIDWAKYNMTVVDSASNGKMALDIIGTTQIDIVFTDIKMPHMDGIELMRHVYEVFPNIIFVVISSYSDYELVRESFKFGAIDYILKFDIEDNDVTNKLLRKLEYQVNMNKQNTQINYVDILIDKIECKEEYIRKSYFKIINISLLKADDAFAISELLIEIKEHFGDFVFTIKDTSILILLYAANIDLMNTMQTTILNILNMVIVKVIGISEIAEYKNRKDLITNSEMALQEQFYAKNENLFFYKKPEKINPFTARLIEIHEEYLNKAFSISKAVSLIDDIFSLAGKYRIDKKKLFAELEKKLAQISTEIKKIKTHTSETPTINILLASENFIDCKNIVKKYFDDIAKLLDAQDDLFFGINRYLENTYGNSNLSLPLLAEHFYMSKRIISTSILANTNMHFKEYLNSIRIKHAKDLLVYHNLRINEVARATGYENVEHFSRLFSREVGVSPSNYDIKHTL